jgi:hypothetical protein
MKFAPPSGSMPSAEDWDLHVYKCEEILQQECKTVLEWVILLVNPVSYTINTDMCQSCPRL